jgi:hypothetical protein
MARPLWPRAFYLAMSRVAIATQVDSATPLQTNRKDLVTFAPLVGNLLRLEFTTAAYSIVTASETLQARSAMGVTVPVSPQEISASSESMNSRLGWVDLRRPPGCRTKRVFGASDFPPPFVCDYASITISWHGLAAIGPRLIPHCIRA